MAFCPKMRVQQTSPITFNLAPLDLLLKDLFDLCLLVDTGLGIVRT
jgi:hypothetical protein